jgi:hypothetical protein
MVEKFWSFNIRFFNIASNFEILISDLQSLNILNIRLNTN